MDSARNAARFGGGHAVILGASIAGLSSARVLAEHFARVTLVERDRLPEAPEVRKSAQQGRHVHVLLGAGLNTLADLFPGLVEDLIEDGALLRDFGEHAAWFHYGVWKARFASGMPTLQCSRALLEHHLRRRVRALANVEILEETTASGLRLRAGGQVAGVVLQRRDRAPEELPAELVADATGRGSRAAHWLQSAGYRRPAETRVGVDITYVSRIYRCPARHRQDPLFLVIYPRPPDQRRAGILYAIEGDRWLVSLSSYFGEHAPIDDAGFVEFSRTLARRDIYDLIRGAEPLTAPAMFRFPSSMRRHFESMRRRPEGLVVLGDAACAFNPIFGQGMSAACLAAKALDRCLRRQRPGELRGLAARFQRDLARVTALPWRLAITEDLRYPETVGARPFWLGAISWYRAKLVEACSYNTRLYGRYLLVLHLLRRMSSLFAPAVVIAVLAHAIRSRLMPRSLGTSAGSAPLHKDDPVTRARLSARFPRFQRQRAS